MGEGRRFHLVECLGEGAHGEVFLAEQESAGGFRRRVALKVLRAELGHAAEAARRMRDEARILGRLAHRNIVTVTDLVRLEDRWAVVMDYLPGADLDRVLAALELADEHFPPRAAVAATAGVLSALHAAWKVDNGSGSPLHLVHRDIKPSNVLLSADGDLKVLDFGVARVDLATREAETGRFRFGTERYMAPERLLGQGDSPAGDVYATMTTLVELLLRDPLGRTPIIDAKHDLLVQGALDRVAEILGRSETTDALLTAIREGLAADPEQRPDAGELAERLGALVPNLPGDGLVAFARAFVPRVGELVGVQGKPASGTLLEATSGPETAADWESGAEATLETSRNRITPLWWALGGAAAILVFVCAGAGASWVLSGDGEATARLRADGARATGQVRVPEPVDVVAPHRAPGEPDLDQAGADQPAVGPEDEAPEVAPRRSPRPAASGPVAAPTPSVEAPGAGTADPEPAERVSAALFALPDASALTVRCGDVERTGTTSVRLRDLPAGPCTVTATYLGETVTTEIDVRSRREVRCGVDGGALRCR